MFKPVNRHILIEMHHTPTSEIQAPIIVLPEDYSPEKPRYAQVTVLDIAPDVRLEISEGDKLIVDRSMVEEIKLGTTIYNVILDNYVVGVVT